MLLHEAFDLYCLNSIAFRNQSKRTEEQHNLALKSLLKHLGDFELSDLTFVHVREWKEAMEKESKTQNTVRGYVIKLRNVLKYMNINKYDCLHPEQVPIPKRTETAPEWLTPEDIDELIHACNTRRGKAIISFLYSSGIRVSEFCNLNRNDLHEGKFTVIGKGGKPRLCFYDERTARLLALYQRSRIDHHPALFVQRISRTRMNKGGVEEVFKQTRRKAGFTKHITPHSMRHSLATNLLQNGMPIYSLSRLLGHSSIQTTSVYLHNSDPRLQEEYSHYHSIKTVKVS